MIHTYKIKGRDTHGHAACLSIEQDKNGQVHVESSADRIPIKLSKREARRFLKIMCECKKENR